MTLAGFSSTLLWALAGCASNAASRPALRPTMTQAELEGLLGGQELTFISCGELVSADGTERHGFAGRDYGPYKLRYQEDPGLPPILLSFEGPDFTYVRDGGVYVQQRRVRAKNSN